MLLVGDSAAMVVYGYDSTIPVTVDELHPARGRRRARLVARDGRGRPAVRLLPGLARAGARDRGPLHEGGRRPRGQARGRRARAPAGRAARRRPASRSWATSASPRSRCTPSAATACRVAARTASRLLQDAKALQAAGAFAVVLEVVPADLAAQVTEVLGSPRSASAPARAPTPRCIVWQDMAGLTPGRTAKFVKKYADLHGVLLAGRRRSGPPTSSPAPTPARSTPTPDSPGTQRPRRSVDEPAASVRVACGQTSVTRRPAWAL